MAMTARMEKMRDQVEVMRHRRKTMQRLVVSQVKSICLKMEGGEVLGARYAGFDGVVWGIGEGEFTFMLHMAESPWSMPP